MNRFLNPIFAILAFVLVLALTPGGVQFSPDSESYIQAARDIGHVGGIPTYYSWWPPLYPLLLAPFADVQTAIRLMNAACYAITVGIMLAVLPPRLRWSSQTLMGAALLLSMPLQYVHQWAWSEPLYLTLVAAWFALSLRVQSWSQVALLGLVAALLALQRYTGVLFIPLGGLLLLLHRVHRKRIAVYLVIAGVPIGLWMLRNVALGYPAMGADRGAADMHLDGAALFAVGTLFSWFPVLLLVTFVGWRERLRLPWPVLITAGYFVLLHVGMVVYSSATTYINVPDNRLLAPVFVPLVILIAALGGKLNRRRSRFLRFETDKSYYH